MRILTTLRRLTPGHFSLIISLLIEGTLLTISISILDYKDIEPGMLFFYLLHLPSSIIAVTIVGLFRIYNSVAHFLVNSIIVLMQLYIYFFCTRFLFTKLRNKRGQIPS